MWQCSVVWYCQCQYQCGSALLCGSVSACTNVEVLCYVILSVPVLMWQCCVVWYYHWLYLWCSGLLCVTLGAFTNVAVLCSLILSVPYQCGSVLLCDIVIPSNKVAVLCDRTCCFWLRGYHLSGRLLTRKYSLFLTHITSMFGWKPSQENA